MTQAAMLTARDVALCRSPTAVLGGLVEHLVVVVPGIGGSVLAQPGERGDVVWDAGKGDISKTVFRPDRLSLEETPKLEPVGLTSSTKLLGFTLVAGYERLIEQLRELGPIDERGDPTRPMPGAHVVLAPYDFRRSIVEAAEHLDAVVNAHLDGLSDSERAGRVIVVGHSMGGLVARVWMGLLERWPWCRALITLGTPHRGAPKALDWLVNGIPFLPGPSGMLRGWPSVVELLPRYRAVYDADAQEALYPHELDVPWLARDAEQAYKLHADIEQAWDDMPRRGPETVPCLGWSHPTANAVYRSHGRLRTSKETPTWLGLDGWEHDFGDGTVPAFSALPAELDQHEHSVVRVQERHVPLAHTPTVADLLRRQMDRRPPTEVHGASDGERQPALGLDLDELHPAGQPIHLAAHIREVKADVIGHPVWARMRSIEGGPRTDVRLEWDPAGQACRGVVNPPAPGLYEVRVTARDVPAAGNLGVTDNIAVIEGE